jgi:hypothetical protein
MFRSQKWCHPLRLSDQNVLRVCHFPHACYTPTQLILLDLITLIIFLRFVNYEVPDAGGEDLSRGFPGSDVV